MCWSAHGDGLNNVIKEARRVLYPYSCESFAGRRIRSVSLPGCTTPDMASSGQQDQVAVPEVQLDQRIS